MKKYYNLCFVVVICILPLVTCNKTKDPVTSNEFLLEISISKWYQNHIAAITLTYDHGAPTQEMNSQIHQLLIENSLLMDYEIVTAYYLKYPFLIDFLLETLIPSGFAYYGHGHEHVNHDNLTYEEALASFSQCYETMQNWGLKPVAYSITS